jgi:sialate O-acetylesterase
MTLPAFSHPKVSVRYSLTLCIVIGCVSFVLAQPASFRLAPIFTDNMVLQQQRDVPVWGKGKPGTTILLQTTWEQQLSAVVAKDGRWSMKLPTPKAGGPFLLYFFYNDSMKVLHNVMIGEVWVCSGQSNMEMPLRGWPPKDTIAFSSVEIKHAEFPSIRLFSVRRAVEVAPSDMCEGDWQECSPRNAGEFSATAFFFGKTLHETLKVPIGLINTSFGGTPIEAWMSRETLASFDEYTGTLKKIDESKEGMVALTQWINQRPTISIRDREPAHRYEGLKFGDDECSGRTYDDHLWNEMTLPTLWEKAAIGDFDGTVWFRKSVAIPSAWIGKSLVLELGPIDDMDETYVNGQPVGSYTTEGFWNLDRIYTIPGTAVPDSVLQIAIRVIDNQGGGGIYGKEQQLCVYRDSSGQRVSLAGKWKYLPVAEYRANVFYVYGAAGNVFYDRPKLSIQITANTPTSLYNGMINPLIPFSIRGAIWYQGESNTDKPELYKKLFPAMINNWRKAFRCGEFPFYFVQIAPYDYGEQTKSQILREAQLQTLSIQNTGMAVILDIGNPKNIHPANKMDVGRRLAVWALGKTYGKSVAYSGPLYRSMKKEKGKIVLSFQYATKGLVVKNLDGKNNFQIAGSDRQFKDADVVVKGNTLIVSRPDIRQPVAVRYAFTNTSEATLFNGEGLPASSFRTDDWEK